MRRLGLGLLALLVLVVAAAVAVPALIPQATLKRLVSERASAALGRELELGGELSLGVLPTIAVRAQDVALGGAGGKAGPRLVELDELQVELAPWPLLSGRVEIARFVLVRPAINLEIDKRGRANWEPQPRTAPGPGAGGTGGPDGAGGGAGGALPAISLADLRIEDGRLGFVDRRSGRQLGADRINAVASLPGLDRPATIAGDLVVQGAKLGFALATGAPAALLAGQRGPLDATVTVGANRVRLAGEAGSDGFKGTLEGELGAIGEFLALAGGAPPALALPERGSLRATIDAGRTRAAVSGLELRLGTIEARGELIAEYGGARPAITGSLQTGALDLTPFMSRVAVPAPAGARSTGTPEAPAPAPAAAEWSSAPLGLPRGLPVDLELALRTAAVTAPPLALDRVQALLRARADRVRVNFEEVGLYGGTAKGVVSVVDQGGTPRLRVNLTGERLQARPLLHAVAGFDRLEGTMRLALNVAASGDSQRRIVETLAGQGELRFTDGAYIGVNVAELIRRFTEPGSAPSGPQQTDFSALGGTFAIRGGILRNDDLELQAPLLRLAGRGQVDLPRQRFDKYRIEPKAVATLKGQGGKRDVRGLLIPFVIDGPWRSPQVQPDLAGAASQLLDQPEVLEKLLPGATGVLPEGVSPETATDLLKGLLQRSPP